MAKAFPGVEILATAIDNVKHNDYHKVWRGKIPYILISLTLVWLTALAFFRNVDRDKVTTIFSGSQIGLLVLSYLAINFTHTYLDFTGPITWAIMYFSVAKIYALANARAMQRLLAHDVESGKKGTAILLMPIVIESALPLSEAMLKKLQHKIERTLKNSASVEVLKGTQSGIWGLFSDIITVSWAMPHDNEDEATKSQTAANALGEQLKSLLDDVGLPDDASARYIVHNSVLNTDKPIASQWRILFAQAIIKLEMLKSEKT
jgi:hypothetical protein